MFQKKILASILLAMVVSALFFASVASVSAGQDQEAVSDVGVGNLLPTNPAPRLLNVRQAGIVVFDNGSLVNGPGTGVGGADESILQTTSLGMGLLGFGHQIAYDNMIADDLVVTGSGYDVDFITFYAYQTGSTTTSTITAGNVWIYDAQPGSLGANVVATSSTIRDNSWSNIYRVSEATTGVSVDRPIMVIVMDMGDVHLAAGTYWLVWQMGGSLPSGPWAPPITVNGQDTTGNALQSPDNGVSWNAVLDSGANTPQGFPFVVCATEESIPTLSEYGMIIFSILLTVAAFVSFRRREFEM